MTERKIERERLIELIKNEQSNYSEDIADYLLANGILTNVVRCKDCKYHKTDAFGQKMCMRGFAYFQMNDDDYCSYGEREVKNDDRT